MQYSYTKTLDLSFDAAVQAVTDALALEGFGVLTQINVRAAMKEKLGVDYNNYTILGACNPPFAHEALQADEEIGLLLPCNVIVYEHDNQVRVATILPTVAMSMVDNPALGSLAQAVEEKLKAVLNSL